MAVNMGMTSSLCKFSLKSDIEMVALCSYTIKFQ